MPKKNLNPERAGKRATRLCDQQNAARLEHTVELSKGPRLVANMVQRLMAEHHIERSVSEFQLPRVPVCDFGPAGGMSSGGAGLLDELRVDVHSE